MRPNRARASRVGPILALGVLTGVPLWASSPAEALLPPVVYQSAREKAPTVLVIAVAAVTASRHAFGTCKVEGVVHTVERGAAHRAGQKIAIDVPCAMPNASPPLGGTIYQDTPELKRSRFGRAYLDASGKLVLSQYEILPQAP